MAEGKKRCAGCGNNKAWVVHNKLERSTNVVYQECNRCFDPSTSRHPDVYFKEPYWDYNLHDKDDSMYDPQRGTFIRSRAHKAYVLKKLQLREAGDKEGGRRLFDATAAQQWEAFK